MVKFSIPNEKKIRVIIDSDAKNEVDDQFALVQALLSESFDIRGIISAHFGEEKSENSERDSYEEIEKILGLMDLKDEVKLCHGGGKALTNDSDPITSEGAELIIEEAMKSDEEPLYIALLGALTDMASALLMKPEIADKNIKIIWIGGGDWPDGGWEYNLQNDVIAANIVFRSSAEVWQIPRDVYRKMPVGFAELYRRVRPCGSLGEYLCMNVIEYNNRGPGDPSEYRILGDSPAVGVMLYEDCGEWEMRPAPEFDKDMRYIHTGANRPIRVYKDIDSRFILEDLYAKLSLFADES